MNGFCKAVIDLIKAAVTDKKANIPDNFNWEEALKLCEVHTITPMLYYGARFSGITPPENVNKKLFIETFCSIQTEQEQQYEVSRIKKAFEENGIDYMLLKGTVLKSLYKKTEMRTMNDADILIKEKQYEDICRVMTDLGFSKNKESDHEYIWQKKDCLTLELHKRLIPSYNIDYYRYFSDGWDFAKESAGHEYFMSREDTFIFLFAHFAKHYRDAGIGIRYMTDLYLYLDKNRDMDMQYIEKNLGSLKLLTFYNNIVATLNVWFEDRESDEVTEFITARIINSGLHGTYYNHVVSTALKNAKLCNGKNEKMKRIAALLFPPLDNMKIKYPILSKFTVLLPWYWCVRLVTAVLYKKENVLKHKDDIKLTSPGNIQTYQKELVFVGLDFEL